MQPLDAPAKTWGNPATKDFRKEHIRVVSHQGTTVLVNARIVDAAANLISSATGPLPPKLEGWAKPDHPAPYGPRDYGIAIRAHENLPEGHGFSTSDGDWLVYAETTEDSTETYEAQNTKPVLEQVAAEARDASERWSTKLPGERAAATGDAGNDVMAFQLFYDRPEQSGVMTEQDAMVVRMLQQRWGIEQTGTLTRDTWRCILPRYNGHHLSYGDSGLVVKILQALLVAYDWDAGEVDMRGYYDRTTTIAVNNLQDRYGLRRAPRVASPEWAALIGEWPLSP
jgi:hypothetical protein